VRRLRADQDRLDDGDAALSAPAAAVPPSPSPRRPPLQLPRRPRQTPLSRVDSPLVGGVAQWFAAFVA